MLLILFIFTISLLVFLIFFGLIRKYIKPNTALQERLRSINDLDTVTGSTIIQASAMQRSKAKARTLKDVAFADRVIKPALKAMENYALRLTPGYISSFLEHRLVAAGKQRQWTLGGFSAVWAGSIIIMLLLSLNYVSTHPMDIMQRLLIILIFCFFGAALPMVVLNITIQKRQKAILHQLPELLDLLCVSVQAGLTFDASIRKITERMKGPLVDECRRMQDDVRMGMVRKQALRLLADRCQIPEVSLFITAIIQAERLGTSMGTTLVNQANNMRERRRQSIKAEALRAPIKILFPLIIFIFPALFIVVLLPTVLILMKNF